MAESLRPRLPQAYPLRYVEEADGAKSDSEGEGVAGSAISAASADVGVKSRIRLRMGKVYLAGTEP